MIKHVEDARAQALHMREDALAVRNNLTFMIINAFTVEITISIKMMLVNAKKDILSRWTLVLLHAVMDTSKAGDTWLVYLASLIVQLVQVLQSASLVCLVFTLKTKNVNLAISSVLPAPQVKSHHALHALISITC